MVNPDVDCYTKSLHSRKKLKKTRREQPTENQKNTTIEIYAKWYLNFYIQLVKRVRPSCVRTPSVWD